MKSLHIEGRRWFRRTAGNTYCTSRIFLDGKLVATLGPTGGYGDQPLTNAMEWLAANGYPDCVDARNGSPKGTLYLRETLHGTYSVVDVPREKDL